MQESKETAEQQTLWRPFHETVVQEIQLGNDAIARVWARLLTTTEIPEGLDVIARAWKEKWGNDYGVLKNILAQKQARMKESSRRQQEFDFADLMIELDQLFGILNGRGGLEPVEKEENALKDCLRKLHRLTAQAIGE